MASKRSADHLAPAESLQNNKKARDGLGLDLGPTSSAVQSSSPAQSGTQSKQKIVKLRESSPAPFQGGPLSIPSDHPLMIKLLLTWTIGIAQPGQGVPNASIVCSRAAIPQAPGPNAGSSTPTFGPIRQTMLDGMHSSVAFRHHIPSMAGFDSGVSSSGTAGVARTQLASISDTIASLEAELHKARQEIAIAQDNAKREQQRAEHNANTIISLKSELAGAQPGLEEMKCNQARLESANANLKARCKEFAKEHSDKLVLQEQLNQERALHDKCRDEKTALESKLKRVAEPLGELSKDGGRLQQGATVLGRTVEGPKTGPRAMDWMLTGAPSPQAYAQAYAQAVAATIPKVSPPTVANDQIPGDGPRSSSQESDSRAASVRRSNSTVMKNLLTGSQPGEENAQIAGAARDLLDVISPLGLESIGETLKKLRSLLDGRK